MALLVSSLTLSLTTIFGLARSITSRVQSPRYADARESGIGHKGQAFPGAVIDKSKDVEAAAVGGRPTNQPYTAAEGTAVPIRPARRVAVNQARDVGNLFRRWLGKDRRRARQPPACLLRERDAATSWRCRLGATRESAVDLERRLKKFLIARPPIAALTGQGRRLGSTEDQAGSMRRSRATAPQRDDDGSRRRTMGRGSGEIA